MTLKSRLEVTHPTNLCIIYFWSLCFCHWYYRSIFICFYTASPRRSNLR